MSQRLWMWISIGLMGVALVAGLACTSKEEGVPPIPQASSAPGAPTPARDEARAKTVVTGGSDKPGESAATPAVQRLIIRNAELFLKVDRVRPAAEAIQAKAKELGGFVVQASTSEDGTSVHGNVTVRVPAEKFDEAVKDFKVVAEKVLSERVTGEDVTDQYVDLDAQLRNLEASRARIVELLQKATHAGEALEVNRALTEVQGQIEQISGRMKYLRQSASLSSIAVTLTQESTVPVVEEDGWKPLRVARMALRALLGFGIFLGNLAIVLAVFSPVWGLIWWLLRGWKRRRAARKAAKAAQAATSK
jgi:hypothetical protein